MTNIHHHISVIALGGAALFAHGADPLADGWMKVLTEYGIVAAIAVYMLWANQRSQQQTREDAIQQMKAAREEWQAREERLVARVTALDVYCQGTLLEMVKQAARNHEEILDAVTALKNVTDRLEARAYCPMQNHGDKQ